jgi:hypothetical protein
VKKDKKHHYHFNTKSLTFEKVKITVKEKVKKILSMAAVGIVFATVVLLFAYNFFNSPKEKMLNREIEQYKWIGSILFCRILKTGTIIFTV